MTRKYISAALAAILLASGTFIADAAPKDKDFKQALKLYRSGMYQSARSIFEDLIVRNEDPLSEGYAVLCAAKMRTVGYESLIDAYSEKYPESVLLGQMHFQRGLDLFDGGDYAAAKKEFLSLSKDELEKGQIAEYIFKRAFCDFSMGNYDTARKSFSDVEKMPFSDFTAPSRFSIGYIDYCHNEFESAEEWFNLSSKDPRFLDYSRYYTLECRFMDKDYRYVVENGPQMFDRIPSERQPRLARIISESYLVMGNVDRAKEFYEKISDSVEPKSRSDYFYAGSMLYAVKDFEGAIENFNRMNFRTDSIGQIASYELGNAYIQTKNKVAAMNAFKEASVLDYDADIKEDAFFNYAKLAFDLNQDGSAFTDYIAKYSKSKRGDDIYSYMALSKLVSRDYAGAVEAYDNIDELSPDMRSNYMKANYLRAAQLISAGSWRDAVQNLQAAAFYTDKRNPFYQLSRYWLAECYYNMGRYEEAEKTYTELYNNSALQQHEEGLLLPYNLAYCYFKEEDYSNAAKWFDNYLASGAQAQAKDASVRRADCDFARKDYKAAQQAYENVLAKYNDPDDIYPYYQLGLSYGLSGDKKKKVSALAPVMDASPSALLYSEAMYELGRAYVDIKDNANAVKCFELLCSNTKDGNFIARSLIELGMISRNASRNDKALEYYKRVVETLPKNEYTEDALLAIESIYQSLGEPEKYIAYVDGLGAGGKKSDAEKEEIYFNSAEQVFLSGNYKKALAAIEKYQEAYPEGSGFTTSQFYAAECFKELGQKEDAIQRYASVLERSDAGNLLEAAVLNYAVLSYGLGHYSDAYNGYSRLAEVARIQDNVLTAKLGMMRSAYAGKDYDKAIAAADIVRSVGDVDETLAREADYVKAKSYLATSRRDEALHMLKQLSKAPSSDEGAEAAFLIIQDAYYQGNFADVEQMVYDFSAKAEGQNYWLAKAFIVLGDSFAEQDNLRQAKATFESVASGYEASGPDDDVLENVRMRLEKLSKMM